MKYALLILALASPVAAQDYATRDSDIIPPRAALSDTILDRDLEYFDGGISRYASDGSYVWTFSENNGGGIHTGLYDIQDGGVICVTYDAGPERCDMFVMDGARLVLLTVEGQRFPLREIR